MPNVTEFTLQNFEENGYSDADALDLASGLLMDAIPCLETIYPTLPSYDQKAAEFAILEMAKYIKIDYFHFERSTSPFASETIGSYSYNKILSNVQNRQSTGVPAFDRAVAKLSGKCTDAAGITSVSSEQVFTDGYGNFRNKRESRTVSRDTWWY